MTTKSAVEDFVAQQTLAVVGVSRGGKKFGNLALKALKAKGYHVFPINPHAESIEGEQCYPTLKSLPERVDGVLIVVPPTETEQVVREAAAAGIRRIWMQQGAESEAAIRFCQENGLSVVHGECILMFARPVDSVHRLHRWIWGLLGKLPH
ncbi:MAG: CoA-binding protein [Acidobacteria bacterium]|nr:CoA-binding protein [Acidobacteriota bacterium]